MHGKLNSQLSDSFVQAWSETMIALAAAAGIAISVLSLAAHPDEQRPVRSAETPVAASAPTTGGAGVDGSPPTSNLN